MGHFKQLPMIFVPDSVHISDTVNEETEDAEGWSHFTLSTSVLHGPLLITLFCSNRKKADTNL
jgi:hypothetical protein